MLFERWERKDSLKAKLNYQFQVSKRNSKLYKFKTCKAEGGVNTTAEGDTGIEKILGYIRNEIAIKKKPFVPWGDLLKESEKILPSYTRPRLQIWPLMEPHVYSISEDKPRSKNPKLYEYKLGAVYYYYPVDMIDECSKKAVKEGKKSDQ